MMHRTVYTFFIFRLCISAEMNPRVMILLVFVILFPVARSTIMAVTKNVILHESLSLSCYNQSEVRSGVELGIHCGMDNNCMAASSDVEGDYPFIQCDCPVSPATPNMLAVDLASVLRMRLYGVQLTGNRINTLRPRQNGRHFADDTFKPIFLNENIRISIDISPSLVLSVQLTIIHHWFR